ncbi:Quinone oxidoreductase 1 [Alphaproteobacteria bacterium]
MGKIAILSRATAPVRFQFEDRADSSPKGGDVLIKQLAVGINDIDVLDKNNPKGPSILGYEGCGVVEAIGEGVDGFRIGDRVAYAGGPPGAYCEYRCISQEYLVKVPVNIDPKLVVASLFKGFIAHAITTKTFVVRSGTLALVHDVAVSTGQIVAQFAEHRGARVLGTIKDEEEKVLAGIGCSDILHYSSPSLAKEVMQATNNSGVHVVYDNLGRLTFGASLASLVTFGVMVSYGCSTGYVGNFDLNVLGRKSLFLTIPSVFDYKSIRSEIILTAAEIFDMLMQKMLQVSYKEYKFAQLEEAFGAVEKRQVKTSVVLTF